jgi:CHAD domain-containing protein
MAAVRLNDSTEIASGNGTPADAWVAAAIARECALLEKSRRHFVREPNEECLHHVRTSGRRLRSLLEDVATVARAKRLAKSIKRAARYTDEARDAGVMRDLLGACLDEEESGAAAPLLRSLGKRERRARRSARKELRGMRFRVS